jgi:hypothetical protein
MTPSFSAFAAELLLIKQAEADEPQMTPEPASAAPVQDEEKPFKSEFWPLLKQRLKSGVAYGLPYGVGLGASYLIGRKVIPKILPKTLLETTRNRLGYAVTGLGAIGTLASVNAMRLAEQAERDAVQRNR